MDKRKFMVVLVATFAIIACYGVYTSQQNVEMTDLAMDNIDAIANGESTETGPYDIEEQITDHYYNGSLYRQSKVIKYYAGGSYACSSGNYYRYKQNNGLWSEWIPV